MAEHPDVARFRQALSARNLASLDAEQIAFLDGMFTPDVVWHGAAGAGADGVKGKEDVLRSWNAFATSESGLPHIAVGDVYADGNHVAAALGMGSGASGSTSTRQAMIFHVGNDGRASEIWSLPTDSTTADAFRDGTAVEEHPNVKPFLEAEEARQRSQFGPDDLATIRRFLADDVLWYMGGQSTWAATQPASLDQVINRFKMFKVATGGTLFFDIHEVFADDTHAASFVTLTADRPDKPDRHMNVDEVNIFHLNEQGRAFEFWGIPTDEAERDAFWADDRDAATRLEDARRALGLPALLSSKGTAGAMSLLEVHLPPGTLLAPVHTHHQQDEASYVLEGEISFYLDGNVHVAHPGDFQFKPRGVPHTIFNASRAPVRFLELAWPGGPGLDEYLEEMAAVVSSGGPPDFSKIAAIARKYRIDQEFASIAELGERHGVRQVGM